LPRADPPPPKKKKSWCQLNCLFYISCRVRARIVLYGVYVRRALPNPAIQTGNVVVADRHALLYRFNDIYLHVTITIRVLIFEGRSLGWRMYIYWKETKTRSNRKENESPPDNSGALRTRNVFQQTE